jgi:hypothetical protein
MTTYTAGQYTATITDDLIVEIRHGQELIDWPGPWDSIESASAWAQARIAELANGTVDGN